MILFCKKCRTVSGWVGRAETPHLPCCGKCKGPLLDWHALQRKHKVDAYDVQDACNFSGVALGFGRLIEELCDEVPPGHNRNLWLTTHPAVVAWMDKLNDLMGRPCWSIDGDKEARVDRAFGECHKAKNEQKDLDDKALRDEDLANLSQADTLTLPGG